MKKIEDPNEMRKVLSGEMGKVKDLSFDPEDPNFNIEEMMAK